MNELSLPSVICPYCSQAAELVMGAVIHGQQFKDKAFWLCRPCKAWVGVHPNSNNRPLGRLANEDLRRSKAGVYKIFDKMTRYLMKRDGIEFGHARAKAYGWLAGRMMLAKKDCHIGFFDEGFCDQALLLCQGFLDDRKVDEGE